MGVSLEYSVIIPSKCFQKFLSNRIAPICGSRIFILLKRFPNENYTSTLIETLQMNHISMDVITSITPSGGLYHQTMYEIATRTNGICAFENDDHFAQTAYYMNKLAVPYTVYSVNIPVSGSGSMSLPPFTRSCTKYCNFYPAMTIQDHGQLDSYRSANLTFKNSPTGSARYLTENSDSLYNSNGTLMTSIFHLDLPLTYNITLDYKYSNNQVQIMQIRIFSDEPIDYWLPYN
uniref:Glycosyltransferase family 92 protein n=1 Tax=Caenorhabditis tropicalis TaxID=1561998 RepID=A0A1I7TTP4_9PELO